MSRATIVIGAAGVVAFVHSDELLSALRPCGKVRIDRLSDVEGTPEGEWTADMSRVGGPVLGPFASRSEALAAEVRWIQERIGELPTMI